MAWRIARPLGGSLATVRRRIGSIRARLALWYLTIMAALLVFFSALLMTTVIELAPTYHDHLMLQVGEQLAETYQPQTGRVRLMHPLPEAGEIIAVIGTSGAVTQTRGPISAPALATLRHLAAAAQNASLTTVSAYPLAAPPRPSTAYGAYDVHMIAVLRDGRRVATLILASPSTFVSKNLPIRFGWVALLGLLTLLTAGAGGFWLVTRALRPVRLVTQTAREISLTDLSRRLNLPSADELGELAATFDQMLSRLDEAFARQRRFTADASHELRTPLAAIQLEAARMLEQPSTHEECLEALAQIRRTGAAMTQLVEDLLVLARSDDGALAGVAAAQVCDLSDQVYDVVERLVPQAHQRHLELRLGSLPEVRARGDPLALERMIGNIVENAIKYTGGVGHQVTIETGERLKGGELWGWVEVADDGPGIAADHLPHIFERFYRAEAARTSAAPADGERAQEDSTSVNGTGLGLAIAQAIAVAHGGEIQVQSGPGQGCQVTIWLPLARRSSSSSAPLQAHALMPRSQEDREMPVEKL
jgi:signal transduction histidine kinase